MLRIALFSPLRPIASGISDYSEELLPHLARESEVTLFLDGYVPSNPLIRRQFLVYDAGLFESIHRRQPFDVCLYHMGNHPSHIYMYRLMQRYPGVVMVHDAVLHHFLRYLFVLQQDREAYLAGFSPELGPSLARRLQHDVLTDVDYFFFPGLRRVVEANLGFVAHSEYTRQVIRQIDPSALVHVVPHHWGPQLSPYAGLPPEEIKLRLGYERDSFLVVSPGIVTPARRIPSTLRVFRRLLRRFPQARCAIVGSDHPEVKVMEWVHHLGLEGLADLTGFVDVPTFQSYILAADVLVNLRYPSAGETSGGLIRALGMGKPILISNFGQYAEFPDDCTLKVDLGENEEDMALAYLTALALDPELGRRVGEQARRYTQQYHAIERSARGYLDLIRAVLEQGPAGGNGCTAPSL
ncbi:MAG: glycosyltransferase [Chloroflexia bacterium]|nr:glycosyltransferase [Chloroflexia bacterium]